jgi:branched-chain amino acid transport system substrate-binding protein
VPKQLVRVRIAMGLSVLVASILVCTGQVEAASAATRATSTEQGVTPTTLKIGILSDVTGSAASSFATAPAAIEARFKAINAAGGINGRKITWVVDDTTSTPAGAETAAKDLVQNKGVFAIAELSSAFYGAAPYLAQAGIPVAGLGLDGPEWSEQPNTNLFSTTGNSSKNGPAYGDGGFYKAIAAHKISYVESNVSAAIQQGNSVYESIKRDGLQACDKTIVPIGSVNFTAFALSFKADGCDAAECACVLSSSLAMATALHQAGLNKVKIIFAAGPTNDIYQNPQDEAAAQNAYFPGIVSSSTYSNAASKAFLAELKKYDPSYMGGIPGLGEAATSREKPDAPVLHHQLAQGVQLDRQRVGDRSDQLRPLRSRPADPVLLLRAVRQGEVRGLPQERQVVLRGGAPRHEHGLELARGRRPASEEAQQGSPASSR